MYWQERMMWERMVVLRRGRMRSELAVTALDLFEDRTRPRRRERVRLSPSAAVSLSSLRELATAALAWLL